MTQAETEITSWHDVAAPDIPDNIHVVAYGETLASIAEKHGHPGEWRTLYNHNVPEGQARERLDPNAITAGLWLELPDDWVVEPETAPEAQPPQPPRPWWMLDQPAPSSTAPASVSQTTELPSHVPEADLIALAERADSGTLDVIEARAEGRTTVLDAVKRRREQLAGQ